MLELLYEPLVSSAQPQASKVTSCSMLLQLLDVQGGGKHDVSPEQCNAALELGRQLEVPQYLHHDCSHAAWGLGVLDL